MEAIKLPVWQDGWEALGGLWRGGPTTGGPAVMTVNRRRVVPLVSKFHRGFGPRGWWWGGSQSPINIKTYWTNQLVMGLAAACPRCCQLVEVQSGKLLLLVQ